MSTRLSIPVETLAAYVPHLLLRRLGEGMPLPERDGPAPVERLDAAVLFADLSGFGAHAARLARKGAAGVEALSELIEAFFGRLIDLIRSHGGDVLKFAGDALVAIWPVGSADPSLTTAVVRAAGCAISVLRVLNEREVLPGVEIFVRVGVGVGEVQIGVVGGVRNRYDIFVSGQGVASAAAAQQHAPPRGAAASPAAHALLGDRARGEDLPGGCFRLDLVTQSLTLRSVASPLADNALGPILRGFVPGVVRSRLDAGQTEWESEIRRATVLFVGLGELADRPQDAHAVVCAAQTALYQVDGSLHHVSVDDKGPMLVAAFGLPPLAHEDDAARGALAALEISAALGALDVRPSIGVASGRVFCGSVGHARRREYSLIGETMIRAARLMQHARGGILCDLPTFRAARDRVAFDAALPLQLKGRADPISVFRPRARRRLPHSGDAHRTSAGRHLERAALAARVANLSEGGSSVAIIEGEAGLGKSHLVGAVLELSRGLTALQGGGGELDRSTPYSAWRSVFAALITGAGVTSDTAIWRTEALSRLARDPALLQLSPLLNALLPLDLPESAATAGLEGDARVDGTRELLVRLLEQVATSRPLLLVLEDIHWLDSASWALLLAVSRRVHPMLLVLTTRPFEGQPPEAFEELLRHERTLHLRLGPVPADETALIIAEALYVNDVPDELVRLIHARGGGYPFFSTELALSMREAGLLRVSDGAVEVAPGAPALESMDLPDTLAGIVTSRIDRLEPGLSLALKVASVLGRQVPLRLFAAVFPVPDERDHAEALLVALTRARLLERAPDTAEPTWVFRDTVTLEVANGLMLHAQRRELHRAVALWLEDDAAGGRPAHALLAIHWLAAGEAGRALSHLERAGELAMQSGAWREAVDAFGSALTLRAGPETGLVVADDRQRARWSRQRGEALLELGKLSEGVAALELAARQIGHPYPRSAVGELGAILMGALSQLLPTSGQPPNRSELEREHLLEAAATYKSLSEAWYLNQERSRTLVCLLRAAQLAQSAGNLQLLARVQANLALGCAAVPLPKASAALIRRARDTALRSGSPFPAAWVSFMAGQIALGAARWADAERELDDAARGLEQIGAVRYLALVLLARAHVAIFRGQVAVASATLDALDTAASEADEPTCIAGSLRARALFLGRQGRPGLSLLERAAGLSGVSRTSQMAVSGQLAAALWETGKLDEARDEAARASALIGDRPTAVNAFAGYAGVAYVALMDAEAHPDDRALAEDARSATDMLNRFARIYPLGRPMARLRRGQGLRVAGQQGRSNRVLAEALTQANERGMPYEEALIRVELSRFGPAAEREQHKSQAEALLAALRGDL